MKIEWLAATSFVLLSTIAFAQDNKSSTGPEDRGKTGWTGGTTETGASSGKQPQKSPEEDARLAASQPLMASGHNLEGPGIRFLAYKTVE
jgi:hypothetical protein